MNVGDYVRTKSGYIDKIININDFREPSMKYALEQPSWNDDIVFIGDEDIKISSPNIIDLIEKGDYVNGMKVTDADWYNENDEYEEGLAFPMYASDDLEVIENWLPLKIVNIKSIVTHEQFENMEYKL